jgi:hypothetical protein
MEDSEATAQMIKAVCSNSDQMNDLVNAVKSSKTEKVGEGIKSQKLKYDPNRRIGVFEWENGKNPYSKKHSGYDMVQSIYDKNPKTLGDLRTVVEEFIEFEADKADKAFMEVVVQLLDDPPIIGFKSVKSKRNK